MVEVEGETLYEVCDRLPGTLGELVRRGEDCFDITVSVKTEGS